MLIIAHRGASGHEPENTLRAIRSALEMGVDAIEVDIHAIEDELIVIHDRWLHRTTNGQGQISYHNLATIRQLDAGLGEQVPTLWEVMQVISGRCDLNIELKSIEDLVPLLRLLDLAVEQLNFKYDQFLLSSFNHHLLYEVKQLQPRLQIGALTASYPLDYAAFAQKLQAFSIHICVDFISEAFVKDAKSRGLAVFVYTVDEEDDIKMMKDIGVDGIFTNYPTKAKARLAHKEE